MSVGQQGRPDEKTVTGRLTDETQDEATRDDPAVALNQARQRGDQPPGAGEEAQVQGRPAHVVEQHVGWDLHQDICNEQDREAGLIVRV